jgi:hypothetical protein
MTKMKEEYVIWITNIQLNAEAAQIKLIWKYISEQNSAFTNVSGHSQRIVIYKENHVNMNFMVGQGLLYFISVFQYHFHPNSVWSKIHCDRGLIWNHITDSPKCPFPIGFQIMASSTHINVTKLQYKEYMTRVSDTHERTQRWCNTKVVGKRTDFLKLLNSRKNDVH